MELSAVPQQPARLKVTPPEATSPRTSVGATLSLAASTFQPPAQLGNQVRQRYLQVMSPSEGLQHKPLQAGSAEHTAAAAYTEQAQAASRVGVEQSDPRGVGTFQLFDPASIELEEFDNESHPALHHPNGDAHRY